MTKIKTNVKKGEDGLVEQRSFVGWKYGPCREKKLKIALLNETDFKVKFKFKVENCVLQISVHPFLGWNIWHSTPPFFLHFAVKLKRKIKICFFDLDKSIWNIWVRLKWGTRMNFPSEMMWINWEKSSEIPIALFPLALTHIKLQWLGVGLKHCQRHNGPEGWVHTKFQF